MFRAIRCIAIASLNTASISKQNSVETAHMRQKRIDDFIPIFRSHILSKIAQYSREETHPEFAQFGFREVIHDMTLWNFFSGVPKPTDEEQQYIVDQLKISLEDPNTHGFTVTVYSSADVFKIDWSNPKSL